MQSMDALKKNAAEIYDLNAALALLSWDQQTYMPRGGAEDRAALMGTLSQIAHTKLTDPANGDLLGELEQAAAALDPDSDEAALLRVFRRDYDRGRKVPADFVAEFAKITALANPAWEAARRDDDFAAFRPHLERIVTLRRQYAEFFAPYDHLYDPLLDEFEPGLKTAEVQQIFAELRPAQVELVKAVAAAPQVDNTFLRQRFDPEQQWDLGVAIISRWGYDWKRGRQDRSAHPFTTCFGLDDVRITTRVDPEDLSRALFSTLHEAGHALYDLGFARTLKRTPLANGASLGIHESQSRLWENLVGRSLDFWRYFYPQLQTRFPGQLGEIPLDRFYRGINRVEPSPIRMEADEATYNLHIMLRLELEIGLMSGEIAVQDLPEIWNRKMEAYLGITPSSNAQGVLQDVHWSYGAIGYFATYALGNLISVQLWRRIQADIPDLGEQIRQGKFEALAGWLRDQIYIHGAKFEPQVLVQRVTGAPIQAGPYLDYLKTKYSEIYGV